MSEVTVGSIWQSTLNYKRAKVVDIYPSDCCGALIAEIEYERDGVFRASTRPSTWLIRDWAMRFEPLHDPKERAGT